MSEAVAPITAKDRVGELDVLRGFALLGVMTINLWEFGGESVTITADQLAALPNAALNSSIEFWLRLFVSDKANTLFACLFGMGFWIQMERLEARGAPFRSIYFRRAGILLIFGWLHFFLLFSWDVLHVYGIAAFILLFSRKLSARTMLVVGGALLLFAKPLISGVFEWSGVSVTLDAITSADSEVLARQAAAQSGDFVTFMSLMAENNWLGWIMNGGLVAWIAYATGRFYIGAWIARKGWIQNAENAEPGTTLSAISAWGGILHALATPLIAIGYGCALILLFNGRSAKWLVAPFGAVGRMALTNYVLQSIAIVLILTGVGPGLALAGKAGIATFLPLVAIFYGAQVLISNFWLKRFSYGPLEWVWRALTYGERPAMRRSTSAMIAQ